MLWPGRRERPPTGAPNFKVCYEFDSVGICWAVSSGQQIRVWHRNVFNLKWRGQWAVTETWSEHEQEEKQQQHLLQQLYGPRGKGIANGYELQVRCWLSMGMSTGARTLGTKATSSSCRRLLLMSLFSSVHTHSRSNNSRRWTGHLTLLLTFSTCSNKLATSFIFLKCSSRALAAAFNWGWVGVAGAAAGEGGGVAVSRIMCAAPLLSHVCATVASTSKRCSWATRKYQAYALSNRLKLHSICCQQYWLPAWGMPFSCCCKHNWNDAENCVELLWQSIFNWAKMDAIYTYVYI